MRGTLVFILTLTLGCPLAAQRDPDKVEPSEETVKATRAADQFAKARAQEGTAQFAKVFHHALEGTKIPLVTERRRRPNARPILSVNPGPHYSSITEDPRYFLNLMQTDRLRKIFGGEAVPEGSYPDVVAVLGNQRICTGTLVTPNVVLTAAHCHYNGVTATVVFGNDAFATDPPPRTIEVDRSIPLAPREDLGRGDLALLFLKESVTDIAPRQIARPEWISAARTVRAVGFGLTEGSMLGIKTVVDIAMASPDCAGSFVDGNRQIPDAQYYGCGAGVELVAGAIGHDKDTCNGDSGGPVLVEAPDGNWYLAAATSRAIDYDVEERPCGDGGIYSRVDTARTWASDNGVTLMIAPAIATTNDTTPGGLLFGGSSTSVEVVRSASLPATTAGEKLDGTITVDSAGDPVLVPDKNPDERLRVTNLRDAVAIRDLPVRVTIEEQRDDAIRVGTIELAVSAEFATKKHILPPSNFPLMTKAIKDLRNAFSDAVTAPNAEAEQQLEHALIGAETAAATALSSVTTSRQPVLEVYEGLRRVRKAYFGRDDRYPPMAYDRIFRNTRGTVGIATRDGDKPFCSGVLVSPRFVMTNRHCLEKEPSSNVEVRFNYELSLTDAALAVDRYTVVNYQFTGGSALDVGFLELDRDAIQPGTASDPKPWPQQCLSTSRVALEAPLYVVGHPLRGFRTVADHTFAVFPFELTETEFKRVRADVQATYAGRGREIERQMLQYFDDAYEPVRLNDTETIYRYYYPAWRAPDREPTLGLDSDTSEGNSGSAVFSRRSHRVVALFVGGEKERRYTRANWTYHEEAIPMTEILAQLERQYPRWADVIQPCIDGVRYGAPDDQRNCRSLCDG